MKKQGEPPASPEERIAALELLLTHALLLIEEATESTSATLRRLESAVALIDPQALQPATIEEDMAPFTRESLAGHIADTSCRMMRDGELSSRLLQLLREMTARITGSSPEPLPEIQQPTGG